MLRLFVDLYTGYASLYRALYRLRLPNMRRVYVYIAPNRGVYALWP